MPPRPYISLVVPIFNEVEIIDELYRETSDVLSKSGVSYEVILVDDGSQDGSVEILRKVSAEDRRVVVVELMRNFGQTAALAAGIDQATGEIIVTMDGDMQHDPSDIPALLEKIAAGYDVVSGCRVDRSDNLWLRRIPSYLANALMRTTSGLDIRDFGSTFKAYRSSLIKQVELFGELHRFIPVLAHRIGARIVEIPIHIRPRQSGSSKYGLRRAFGVFQDIIFLEFFTKYLTKPIRAFGKLFLIFFGGGFSISLYLILLWAIGSISGVWQHSALLIFSVFLMIVGVQFLVAGIFAELLTRIYLNTGGGKIYTVRQIHKKK